MCGKIVDLVNHFTNFMSVSLNLLNWQLTQFWNKYKEQYYLHLLNYFTFGVDVISVCWYQSKFTAQYIVVYFSTNMKFGVWWRIPVVVDDNCRWSITHLQWNKKVISTNVKTIVIVVFWSGESSSSRMVRVCVTYRVPQYISTCIVS